VTTGTLIGTVIRQTPYPWVPTKTWSRFESPVSWSKYANQGREMWGTPLEAGVNGSSRTPQRFPPLRLMNTPESRPPATTMFESSGSKARSEGCTYPPNPKV
jgi:hypothetical protein